MNRTIKHAKEDRVWFTSDLHFGHNKEFLYKPRGFETIEEMNNKIIENLKVCVGENDYLYICGDLALCPLEEAEYWLRQLPGKVRVIIGNHDTDARLELYEQLGFEVFFGARLRWSHYHFFLSHYPTLTANPGEDKLSLAHINLFGHTHDQSCWHLENPYAYNVGMDAHNCYPCRIDHIVEDLKLFI